MIDNELFPFFYTTKKKSYIKKEKKTKSRYNVFFTYRGIKAFSFIKSSFKKFIQTNKAKKKKKKKDIKGRNHG